MFGLPTNQVVAIGVLIVGGLHFAWVNRDKLAGIKLPFLSKSTKPDRKAILSLLDDAHSFFEEQHCKEGMAAIRTAMGHVYHEEASR